jgi:hypothetical protein
MYVYIYVCVSVRISESAYSMYVCKYVYLKGCMCMCMYVCMYVSMPKR